MKRQFSTVLAAIVALAFLAAPTPAAEKPKPLEIFTGRGFSMQGGQTGFIEVAVYRWSTEGEREVLKGVLKAVGSSAMVDELQKMPEVGYVKMPNSMGKTCYYAFSENLPDGGRRVVVATDRFVAMQTASPQASEYDLAIVEMRFDKSGKGEGKIVVAGKASFDKDGKIQIANYQGEPVRFLDIKSKKP